MLYYLHSLYYFITNLNHKQSFLNCKLSRAISTNQCPLLTCNKYSCFEPSLSSLWNFQFGHHHHYHSLIHHIRWTILANNAGRRTRGMLWQPFLTPWLKLFFHDFLPFFFHFWPFFTLCLPPIGCNRHLNICNKTRPIKNLDKI